MMKDPIVLSGVDFEARGETTPGRHPLTKKAKMTKSLLSLKFASFALLCLMTGIEAQASPLSAARPPSEPAACATIRSGDARIRAKWMQDLGRGKRDQLLVAAEMMELGILPQNRALQRSRLQGAATDQRAKYNLIYAVIRDLQTGEASREDAARVLALYDAKDFSGNIGAKIGYLYWLAANLIEYKSAPDVYVEALRMAFGGGIAEAAVPLWRFVQENMPDKVQDKAFLQFFRMALDRYSDRNFEAMRLRANLWASGVYGGSQDFADYRADLYGTVSDLMARGAGVTIEEPWALRRKTAKPEQYAQEILRDAQAYIRARAASHSPTAFEYLLVCQWSGG